MVKKYDNIRYAEKPRRKKEIHPIWRGIGFLMIVLIPIISYAGMMVLLSENNSRMWFRIPIDLLAQGNDPLLYVKIIITVVIMCILYLIFLFITFMINRLFGPSRFGPQDAEPTTFHGPRYKR